MLERELAHRIRTMRTRDLWECNDRAHFMLTHAPNSHSNFCRRVLQLSGRELMKRTPPERNQVNAAES